MTATTANANGPSVTCRCQPVRLRTSYSSSPPPPSAGSKHSSTTHRFPATVTDSASAVAGRPPHTKSDTSDGRDGLRRISRHRWHRGGFGQLSRVRAHSYHRGPLRPAPLLSRGHASAGTSASNAFARTRP